MTTPTPLCPCGTGLTYDDCCGAFHRGDAKAPTAERLMRSRYSAFVTRNAEYLLETWHPDTRPDAIEFDPAIRWTGLMIEGRRAGGMLDRTGTVEFVARYRANGRDGEQREHSRFVRDAGGWLYVGVL